MRQPKKQKYRKQFRGKIRGQANRNNLVTQGEYGLKSLEGGWINAREIEAARRAVTGYIRRKGKVWVKIFPDKPYTSKSTNSKMEGGKGMVEGYVAVVRSGNILIEVGGVKEEVAREALRLAGHKFSVKTKFVKKIKLL